MYLYLDFNNEFANFGFNNKSKKLEDMIKDLLKSNKIDFNGVKVIIMIGEIALGTLLLNEGGFDNNISYNSIESDDIYAKQEEIIDIENDDVVEEEVKEIIKDSDDVIDSDNNDEVQISQDKSESVVEESKKDEEEKQNSIDKVDNSEVDNSKNDGYEKESSKVEETGKNEAVEDKIEKKEENEKKEDIVDNKTYVTVYRTSGVVETIELEEYVIGVVGAEMPASFNIEALKAQAVIARTYALKALKTNKVLTDSSSTQNYKDNEELRKMWGNNYNTYYNKIKSAVESTEGMYLVYNGEIIEAVYHSTSNGYTESSVNVWGNYFPYLVSVESPYDSINPSFEKEVFFTYEDLGIKLQSSISSETLFNVVEYTSGNRVKEIEVNGVTYSGVEFRNLLGLRSADFVVESSEEGIIIITRGYGHGVGLSQYGANGMAKNGYTYNRILTHYYKGVILMKNS